MESFLKDIMMVSERFYLLSIVMSKIAAAVNRVIDENVLPSCHRRRPCLYQFMINCTVIESITTTKEIQPRDLRIHTLTPWNDVCSYSEGDQRPDTRLG